MGSLRPGDTSAAYTTVHNDGNLAFTYSLTIDRETPPAPTPSPTPSILDTNTTDGLQLQVLRCDPLNPTLCTEIVYAGPAVMTTPAGGPDAVGAGGAQQGLAPGSQDYLELRFTLPASAGNAFQGASSVLRFSWTATEAS